MNTRTTVIFALISIIFLSYTDVDAQLSKEDGQELIENTQLLIEALQV